MSGNPNPIKLYTIDLDSQRIHVVEDLNENQEKDIKQIRLERIHNRIKRNNLRDLAS